jgi:uncharacterized phiE125 gp8 family phage protein
MTTIIPSVNRRAQTGLKLVTAPTVDPVTETEAWNHLRIDLTGSPPVPVADRDRIALLLKAAVADLDGRNGWLNRALITQTWELQLEMFPPNEIALPLPPLQSVVSVKYDDVNGAEQTVPVSDYKVDTTSRGGRIVLVTGKSWPATLDQIHAVRIQFTAGYGDSAADVPEDIKAAVLLHLEILYDANPAARETLERARDALIDKHAVWTVP